MPNRAERRAQAKRAKRGETATTSRNTRTARAPRRDDAVDEYSLQQRSLHLQESSTDEWKPSASTEPRSHDKDVTPDDLAFRNPKKAPAPSTVRGWGRFFSWLFIVLSAIAFIIVMFLPSKPLWAIVTGSVIFILGVLSLFLFGGSPSENPNVDSNGTAV